MSLKLTYSDWRQPLSNLRVNANSPHSTSSSPQRKPTIAKRSSPRRSPTVKLFLAADSLMSLQAPTKTTTNTNSTNTSNSTSSKLSQEVVKNRLPKHKVKVIQSGDSQLQFDGWVVCFIGRFVGGREPLEKIIHDNGGQCMNHYNPLVTHILVAEGAASHERTAYTVTQALAEGRQMLSIQDIYSLTALPMPPPPVRKPRIPKVQPPPTADVSPDFQSPEAVRLLSRTTTTTTATKRTSSDEVKTTTTTTTIGTPTTTARVTREFLTPDSEAASMLSLVSNAKRKRL